MHLDLFKRTAIVAVVISTLICGCSNSGNHTRKEYNELVESTKIGTIDSLNLKNDLSKAIVKIYAPTSEKDITEGIVIIGKYSTEALVNNLKSSINSYKEDAKQTCNIKDIEFRTGEEPIVLCDFEVNFMEKYKNVRVFLEFYINSENKIYRYDVNSY